MKKGIRYGAASVIGKAHLDDALPNQDAFLIKNMSYGTIIVMADGMGSKKKADIGSKMICRAVCEAVEVWIKYRDVRKETLIKLIHSLWNIYISPNSKEDCGTTCLFAIILKKKIIFGQLGDGMISYEINKSYRTISREKNDFSNMTNSIHSVKKIDDWVFEEVEDFGESIRIMMCTDGISEDLIEDKVEKFLAYLSNEILQINDVNKRNRKLKEMILDWPTKFSSDDKTLVIFERREVKKWKK